MSEPSICDYSDFDYKTEFWTKSNRNYENKLEHSVIRGLLKVYCKNKSSILDAGCGFGRLFKTYQPFFKTYCLVDYAQNLLDQAKEELDTTKNILFYKQSLYELHLPQQVDTILSVRTLHHLNDTTTLFNRFNKQLKLNGHLILDIPNHYHIKNRLKYPFKPKKDSVALSKTFFNYNPDFIIQSLTAHGFTLITKKQVGLFRLPLIKSVFPATFLITVEKCINLLFCWFNIAPSVYVIVKKTVDKYVDN
jgi:SAM-dependent methyltransferase